MVDVGGGCLDQDGDLSLVYLVGGWDGERKTNLYMLFMDIRAAALFDR